MCNREIRNRKFITGKNIKNQTGTWKLLITLLKARWIISIPVLISIQIQVGTIPKCFLSVWILLTYYPNILTIMKNAVFAGFNVKSTGSINLKHVNFFHACSLIYCLWLSISLVVTVDSLFITIAGSITVGSLVITVGGSHNCRFACYNCR